MRLKMSRFVWTGPDKMHFTNWFFVDFVLLFWFLFIYIYIVHSKRVTPINTTILSPHVHMLGDDAACICYVRLQQFLNR